MTDFEALRSHMVEAHIAARGVKSTDVLSAMRQVPREAFVPERLVELAYEDTPLPIAAGQTISQPYIVAAMLDAAQVARGDQALEIGAGSGYAAAILSRIALHVVGVERHAELADAARRKLHQLGYDNITIIEGDGTLGWPGDAPYDVIVVSAGGPSVPRALLQQLAVHGRLVIPIGPNQRQQRLLRFTRLPGDQYREDDLGPVQFVPLIGAQGWAEQAS
jgi:protein-L-isoaspartate(D-aspartate) O-methyltransferase